MTDVMRERTDAEVWPEDSTEAIIRRTEAKVDALNERLDAIEGLFRGLLSDVKPYIEQAGPVIEQVQRMVQHPIFRTIAGESAEDRAARRAERKARR